METPIIRKGELELSIEREIPAARSLVWRCWTEAELLEQWYCPKPWQVSNAELDVRPGGRFNCTMKGPDGERIDTIGSYLLVEHERRLVFTDAYAADFFPRPDSFMTGLVDLSDADNGRTRQVWTARHSTPDAVKMHLDMGFEAGWAAAAEQLAELASDLK